MFEPALHWYCKSSNEHPGRLFNCLLLIGAFISGMHFYKREAFISKIKNLFHHVKHRIKFRSIIRGHHVYQTNWTPVMKESIFAKPDKSAEALEYDWNQGKGKQCEVDLVGHAPLGLSSLLYHILNSGQKNFIRVTLPENESVKFV